MLSHATPRLPQTTHRHPYKRPPHHPNDNSWRQLRIPSNCPPPDSPPPKWQPTLKRPADSPNMSRRMAFLLVVISVNVVSLLHVHEEDHVCNSWRQIKNTVLKCKDVCICRYLQVGYLKLVPEYSCSIYQSITVASIYKPKDCLWVPALKALAEIHLLCVLTMKYPKQQSM